jgi:hypothetical protein
VVVIRTAGLAQPLTGQQWMAGKELVRLQAPAAFALEH